METLSVVQSLLIALWVAAVMSRWLGGGATLTLRFSPLMTGLVCGIIMGDVSNAMIVTAALQLIYMGVFSPGGSMPSEPAIAAAIAVPVALLGNLTPEAAIGVAVPVGLLGSYLYQFRFFLNTFLGKYTDKAVEKMDEGAIKRSIIWYPTIASFLLFVPLVFAALYWGAPVIADVINQLKETVFLHVLEVVGGGLAAIGISTKSLRLLPGSRLLTEAAQALEKALCEKDMPIVAFRVNPDKYRRFVAESGTDM